MVNPVMVTVVNPPGEGPAISRMNDAMESGMDIFAPDLPDEVRSPAPSL